VNPETALLDVERQLPLDPRAKRTEGEKVRDLEVISSLYLRGMKPGEIAEELVKRFGYAGLSAGQIQKDLRDLREMWVKSALIQYDEAKAREIAHIDELEAAAWDAWNKSWGKQTTKVIEDIEDRWGHKYGEAEDPEKKRPAYLRKRDTEATKDRFGDPRYLDAIKWCIEQRCKILGLHEPLRLSVTWKEEATKFGIKVEDADALYKHMVSVTTKALRDKYLADNTVPIPDGVLEGEFEDYDDSSDEFTENNV
jgi:hypothetical protein